MADFTPPRDLMPPGRARRPLGGAGPGHVGGGSRVLGGRWLRTWVPGTVKLPDTDTAARKTQRGACPVQGLASVTVVVGERGME